MDKNFRFRLGIVYFSILVFGLGVLVRAGYLMLVPSERLSAVLKRQFREAPPPKPRRGMILDRNREPLAVSLDVFSLYANPNRLTEAQKKLAIQKLPRALGLSKYQVRRMVNKDREFVWIKRHLNKKTEAKVRSVLAKYGNLRLAFGFAKESKRFYPNASLAANLVGFTGTDSNGLEGLEYFYEKELSGKIDSSGEHEGKSLVLTIDKGLQHTVEQELKKTIDKYSAKSGTAIIMDADNGDIWAMASYPTFNPNKFKESKANARRNRAVSVLFEPGSTVKPLVVAGGLENNIITPKTKFYCEKGELQIGENLVRESSETHKWEWLTTAEVIKNSSNIGATKIGFRIGKESLYDWYRKLGLTQKTGLDMPGEASGMLKSPDSWREIYFSNVSFGQGISVTAIQLVRAFASIANGGFLVRPRIVRQLEDIEGEIKTIKPINMGRVMRQDVANQMEAMLTEVTSEDGTGKQAKIPGFTVAGKTGTAQVAEPGVGYASGKYVASFIGYAVDVKPRFVGLVVIEEPEKPHIFGGETAAPAFKNIMTAALVKTGVSPTKPDELEEIIFASKPIEDRVVSKLAAIAKKEKKISEPLQVKNIHDRKSMIGAKEEMPELIDMPVKDVILQMSLRDVRLKINGRGIVKKYYPVAGSKLKPGQAVSVFLSMPEEAN